MDSLETRIGRLTSEQRALLRRKLGRDPIQRAGADSIPPRGADESRVASFAQERLWFLDRLSPGDPYYNEPLLAIRLMGRLDGVAMQRTLDEIVRRHETLRTTFTSPQGRPVPVIHPATPVRARVVDLQSLEREALESAVAVLAREEGRRPFDLGCGPLMRVTILKCGPADHILFVAMHHIITDGWSLRVLLHELAAFYDAFSGGRPSPLPPLPIQYADYAAWQRSWLQGPYLAKLIDYWKKQLASAPVDLRLPADRRRPQTPGHNGAQFGTVLDTALIESLREVGKRRQCTLYMVLLAAFQVVLHRYSGQDEFLVGTPVAGRDAPEVEGLIGFFVNTLVIRADLSGDPDFLELLDRVRATVVQALAHQELPFEKLVETLRPVRDPSKHPVFNVMFAHHNFAVRSYDIPALSLRRIEVPASDAKFDLVLLSVEDEHGTVDAQLVYSTDLFDAVTIEGIWGRFLEVLNAVVADPAARMSDLHALRRGADSTSDVVDVDGHDAWTPWFPPHAALSQLFEAQAARQPDAVALVDGERRLTYAEVNARANQIARLLIARGARPEGIVGLALDRHCEALVCLLAILKTGAAYLPLDPTHPRERNQFVLGHAGAQLLLTASRDLQLASAGGIPSLAIDAEADAIAAQEATDVRVSIAPDNLAYVMYTSGTTGQPKGVAVPHRSVVNIVQWQTRNLGMTPASRVAQIGSLCFDGSVGEIFVAFANGATLVLLDAAGMSPEALMRAIVDGALTDFAAVPSLLRLLDPEQLPATDPPTMVSIGEACPVDLALKWARRCPFGNGYGPTETTVASHFWTADPAVLASASSVPIGRPICNVSGYILDESLRPVAPGEAGELFIGGAGVARGYLNDPALTATRFLPDPFGRPGSRMYRTGDLVRGRRDGALEFIARLDHQVKLRGYRIEVNEIEHAFSSHPAVERAVVEASDVGPDDKRLTAFLVDNLEHERADIDLAHVAEWRAVMENLGGGANGAGTAMACRTDAWVSSYTGRPLSAGDMDEWWMASAERILRNRHRRILEIGCGSAPLLPLLGSGCQTYWGTDFCRSAIDGIHAQGGTGGALRDIRVLHQRADEFETLRGTTFDVVVLNSVVQYFPSVHYLLRVIEGAIDLVEDGGTVFLGDIRSLPLLTPFRLSVGVHRANPELTLEETERGARQAVEIETELALAPELFAALGNRIPRVRHVDIEPRRGRHSNELTNFRYDVTLYIGGPASTSPETRWLDWQGDGLSVTRLARLLEGDAPDLLCIRDVPNARLSSARAIVEWLGRSDRPATIAKLRALIAAQDTAGVDPETIWHLEYEFPYRVSVGWGSNAADGRFDVILARRRTVHDGRRYRFPAKPPQVGRWRELANCPTRARRAERLLSDVHALAKERLPDYMIPSSFKVVEAVPLNRNGKTDRRALALLCEPVPQRVPLVPRGSAEELLALIWADLLRGKRPSASDDFFEQEGHSLLAVQLVSRINEAFSIDLPVRAVFESPRLGDLAQTIERFRQGAHSVRPPIRPVLRSERIPLSSAQARLWFLEQLEPHNPFYNVPSAVRLTGSLDVAALSRVIDSTCRRHESLRTRFPSVDGDPVQAIDTPPRSLLHLIDLQDVSEAERNLLVDRLARAFARRPFDLARDRLIRTSLLRLSPREHVLLLTVHHIVCDGWSMNILIRDIAAAYESGSPLPEIPVQYADYAAWQRHYYSDDEAQRQLAYWKAQLDGCATIELPCDRPRPPVQTYRGSTQLFHLRQSLVERIDAIGRRNGATLFMTLVAIFQTLLSRYTGQTDIAVGTPIANRDQPDIENLVGFFANTLVLRTDLSGDPSFRELLRRVRKVALDAYDHRAVPFEEVVRTLQPDRDLSRSPLFQVWFTLLGLDVGEVQLPDLRLGPMEVQGESSKFDLSLSVLQTTGGLQCSWEYSTDLFDDETIRQMAEHFQRVADAATADADSRLSALPLLDEAERSRVLVEWNQTHRSELLSASATDGFEQQARQSPDRPALVFGTQALTYGEVGRRALRLAQHLRSCGAGAGRPVAICMDRGPDMVVAVLAILSASSAFVPVDPSHPADRLCSLLRDCGADLVVTSGGPPPHLSGLNVRFVDATAVSLSSYDGAADGLSVVFPDQVAYIIYTSGSAGEPKGVRVPHRAVVNVLAAMAETLELTAEDRWLAVTPLSFDISVLEILLPLAVGATVVIVPSDAVGDGARLKRLLAASRPTILQTTPLIWRDLIESGWSGAPALTMISGGEALPSELAARLLALGGRLFNAYGPTETTVWSTIQQVSKDTSAIATTVPIGRPLSNTRCYVLDGRCNPVPPGVAGELFIAGLGVASGYHERAALTAERFVPDPFDCAPGARMYRTGDRVRYRGDGSLEFLGRLDEQLKIRGVRIEPEEIEATLCQHPHVRQAAVVAVDAPLGSRLRAFIVAEEALPSTDELLAHLQQHVPQSLIPAEFVALRELPRTTNGKVDRRALKAAAASVAPTSLPAPPRTPAERQLIEICAAVFPQTRVGVHDDFFETLGGHSLRAIRLVSRARDAFGVHVPVRWIFETRTMAGLAARIEAAQTVGAADAAARPLAPSTPAEDEIPLSSIQHRIWFLSQIDPTAPLFHVPVAVRIHGSLDFVALSRALNDVTARHDLLRATLSIRDGWPSHFVGRAAEVRWAVTDLAGVPPSARELEAERQLQVAATRPFDLSTEAPLRADIIRIGADDHVVSMTLHHIAADAWSVRLLVRELLAFYGYRTDGVVPSVHPQVEQHAAYASAERDADPDGGGLAYWCERLREPVVLHLSADAPRPSEQSYRGSRVPLRLDRVLTEQLRARAREHDATLFTALLAVWAALLSRYTGQGDILVGSPISVRHRTAFEAVIGPLINTVVFRVNVEDDPTATELLDRVRERVLEGLEHATVPFQRVVEALRPERTMRVSPLYQVMFAFDEEAEALTLPGFRVEPVDVQTGAAQCDLALSLEANEEGVRGHLEYRTDLFEHATAVRVVRHFETLLRSFLGRSDRRVSELAIIPENELKFLHEAGSGQTSGISPDVCLIDLVEQQAALTPSASAAEFDGRSMTYEELNRRANQLARHLQGAGAAAGTVVALLMERSIEALIGLLATWKVRGVYLPLDPSHPDQQLRFMLDDSKARLVLSRADVRAARALESSGRVTVDVGAPEVADRHPENLPTGRSPADVACHLYTSGSTGKPKAVRLLQRNLSAVMLASRGFVGLRAGDVMPAIAPLGFDISLFELLHPILAGASTRILRREDVLNPIVLSRSVQTVTCFHAVPSVMRAILDALAAQDIREILGVERIFIGGELVPPRLIDEIRRTFPAAQVRIFYGPTEGSIICTTYAVPDGPASIRHLIGRPLAHAIVRVCDSHGHLVPVGVPGEIVLGSDAVAAGYVNRPDETAARFSTSAGARFYRTGDLGRWESAGNLEFLGRIDRQVKIRGHRVEPADVEAALVALPVIGEAVVDVRTGATGDAQLVAYVVPERSCGQSARTLRAQLRAVLPDYMVPSVFVMLDALPVLTSGKPDRTALRALPISGGDDVDDVPVPPATSLERRIADAWKELLEVEAVGLDDNLFELGAHSLLLMRLQTRLQRDLGLPLTIIDLFRYPTVRLLAQSMAAQETVVGDELSLRTVRRQHMTARSRERRLPARERCRGDA
jgi:amino acid adenylation domain-containing protein